MPKTFITHALTAAAVAAAGLPVITATAVSLAPPAAAAGGCTGTIAVADGSGGSRGGFARDLESGRFAAVTSDPAAQGQYRVSAASDADADADLREIAPVGDYAANRAWLGAALQFANQTEGDLGPGMRDFVYLTHGVRTAPGAPPARVENAFSLPDNARPYESAVWTVDDDGVVGMRWITTQGDPVDLTSMIRGTNPIFSGDRNATSSYWGGEAATFTFVPDEGTAAACDFDRTPQVITFGEDTPATGFVGRATTVSATGGDSGNPVTFSSETPTVCTVDEDGEVSYLAAGTCTVAADQDGSEGTEEDPGYADAETATTDITVALEPSTTVVTATEDPVVGQDVELTAEVSSDDGAADVTPAGTVQFSVDDVAVGDPVAVDDNGQATYDAGPLAMGAHDLDAVFTPTEADVVASSDDDAVVTVAAAETTTALTVGRRQVEAEVTVDEPGAGTPTGEVVFTVDSVEIGRAPLVDGVATLNQSVPSGAERTVAATYTGSDDFNGSSDSTDRTDPVVTTTVTSPEPQTNGWYTAPVTVTFDCADDDAALTKPCPAPVTRSKRGADITVTRTIRALDGGTTTLTETFSIDKRGPFLSFAGIEPRTVYPNGVPARARCTAVDDLSGVDDDGCTLRKKRVAGTNRVVLTATATDVAGNPSTKSIVVFVPRAGGDRATRPLG